MGFTRQPAAPSSAAFCRVVEPSDTVAGRGYRMALGLEHDAQDVSDVVIVVNDEDAHR